jgi:hypothetical protein
MLIDRRKLSPAENQPTQLDEAISWWIVCHKWINVSTLDPREKVKSN